MSSKLSFRDLKIRGKNVLIRVDFNVPLNENQDITDDTRIVAALPTIQHVLNNGGSAVIMSHLGRPKGKKVDSLSLLPCARRLSKLLDCPVKMAPDCIGSDVEVMVQNLNAGEVMLLENLRFHNAEEHPDDDPEFVKNLASLGDVYINDAFGTAHRAHASTTLVSQYFPGRAAAGFLLEKEITMIGKSLLTPERPFYALIGGAKISTKIGVIKSLIKKVDGILIGGGMSYTFLKAQGISIGDSIHEDDFLETSRDIIEECSRENIDLALPIDLVIANEYSNDANSKIIDTKDGIPNGYQGMGIGPETVQKYSEILKNAKTIIWNGPVGVYEFSSFATSTIDMAKTVAGLSATTIIGGGDCVAAINAAGVADKISHISTGGGAALEYIEFGTLPGIEALSQATS